MSSLNMAVVVVPTKQLKEEAKQRAQQWQFTNCGADE
jgi:hypothetical protein